MEYFYKVELNSTFEDAEKITTEALKNEGFGIITEIDMQAKLYEKLGVEFKKYKILGACNPAFALKALQAEEKIGLMLPCNVVIIDKENGTTEVAAIDPVASMMAIQNSELHPLAMLVREKIQKVINQLKLKEAEV